MFLLLSGRCCGGRQWKQRLLTSNEQPSLNARCAAKVNGSRGRHSLQELRLEAHRCKNLHVTSQAACK
jgi:hypothetical protein